MGRFNSYKTFTRIISIASFLLLAQFAILASPLVPNASAASAYDNVVHTTHSAIIKRGEHVVDISTNWDTIIADCDNWYEDSIYAKGCAAFNADLATAHEQTTGWAIGVREVKSPHSTGASGTMDTGDKYVQVSVNTNADNYGVFSGNGADARLNLSSASFTQTCSVYIYYQVNYNSRTGQAADPTRPQVIGMACENSNASYTGIAHSHEEYFYNAYVFFFNSTINYPPGYEGKQLLTSPPSPRNYIALGDSFSSGEGNPPFEAGTESNCHRSSSAYPHLLSSSLYIDLTNFVACAGATTSDIDSIGSSDQATVLSQSTDIVTLTVGGNDVGFKDFATACTISLCDFSTQAYQNIHNKVSSDLPSKLADTYEAIDDATSSNAKIYVLGYPYLAPSEMPTGASSACWPLNGGVNNSDPTQNNGATVYAVQNQLNNTIQQAVADYGSSKFQYIDPNEGNSPFIGHDWCSQNRYFVQVALNQTSYSYHPNVPGHAAYAAIMRSALD